MARISRLFPTLAVALALIAGAVYLAGSRALTPSPASPSGTSPPPSSGGSLVVSLRRDPPTYNRLAPGGNDAATELVTLLTQARLLRINRITDALEPSLAERWEPGPGPRAFTLHLRRGLRFSDGAPFSADDVLFSFEVVYAPAVESPIRPALEVEGKPLAVTAPDPDTVIVTFPSDYGPGLRILDNLPILPKHVLAPAFAADHFRDAWTPAGPPTDVVGLGPFVLREHVSGQRLAFARNPHFFGQDERGIHLPYLDTLTIRVVSDQGAEALQLQNGEVDLASNAGIRPDDYVAFRRLADEGRLSLHDIGVSLDPDFLWFNLSRPAAHGARALLGRKEFRQAVSAAVDRQAIVNGVYLGAAEPIVGPVSPGNRTWFDRSLAAPRFDPARARELFASLGLADRDGDGMLETPDGEPVRFSLLTQAGHLRSRVGTVLQEQLRKAGVGIDLVTLDGKALVARWAAGDYDAIYFGLQASATDPALNPEFWLSNGESHVWHPSQPVPATPWEARIDALFHQQAAATDPAARQAAFNEIQQIVVDEAPAIYFVAPHVIASTSPRVRHATPALLVPQFLWNPESLAAAPEPPSH